MLTISRLRNFYFIPEFTDMPCKAPRVLEIVHRRFGREPYDGDVFIFMSRNRKKLRMVHFEDNAYNYIDNWLVKMEHICCLAHARAKFKYAQEQGQDDCATYFLGRIAKLYQLENGYKRQNPSFDEKKTRRNSAEMADILTEMRYELKRLRDDGSLKGDLMEKALNYLDYFWKQIFNYRKDGCYSIDNSIVEQCIRSLTRERSNSIHFASHRGAEVSAIFHTIFSCGIVGVSALDYLKNFFEAMLAGRTDYDNLLPSTIGLKSK